MWNSKMILQKTLLLKKEDIAPIKWKTLKKKKKKKPILDVSVEICLAFEV